jgi:hypothetical protein
MINHENTEHARVHIINGNDRVRVAGGLHPEDPSGNHRTELLGHRWKANMAHASTTVPYAATLKMRSAWYAPSQSWMRPVHVHRPGHI